MREPEPGEIRWQVEKICASKIFGASPRHQDLLRFVVEATLIGPSPTEKSIAVGFYEKDPDTFYPALDSTARVGVGKLREMLREYYEGEGKTASVSIVILRYAALAECTEYSPLQSEIYELSPDAVNEFQTGSFIWKPGIFRTHLVTDSHPVSRRQEWLLHLPNRFLSYLTGDGQTTIEFSNSTPNPRRSATPPRATLPDWIQLVHFKAEPVVRIYDSAMMPTILSLKEFSDDQERQDPTFLVDDFGSRNIAGFHTPNKEFMQGRRFVSHISESSFFSIPKDWCRSFPWTERSY